MNCCNRYLTEGRIISSSVIGGTSKPISSPKISLNIDEEFYKIILINHNPNSEIILKGLDIVKKYVIREKLIIVGGMAIDFALRLKGSKLYNDDEIPDYDFNTPHHWIDAYEIVQWLNRTGINNLSVINAFHPTTMRVRISSTEVADVTYVPKNIYDKIPRLNYHGFEFAHPYHQYVDQHRALTYGYENIDMDRPVLKNRWTKDMKRYDLLWGKYPLKFEGNIPSIELSSEKVMSLEFLQDQCLGGFLALQYWINWAKPKGFQSSWHIGECQITANNIKFTTPTESNGITLYSNHLHKLYDLITKKHKIKSETFYDKYVDKLPRKIILDNEWELFDNADLWMAAIKDSNNFYIANLQPIMLYMLVQFLSLKRDNQGYLFYAGYMICRELLKFAADKMLPELLPTADYYGNKNITDTYKLVLAKFMSKNQKEFVPIPKQPKHVYDHDLIQRKVYEAYYKFDPESSELFRMSGNQTSKFWE